MQRPFISDAWVVHTWGVPGWAETVNTCNEEGIPGVRFGVYVTAFCHERYTFHGWLVGLAVCWGVFMCLCKMTDSLWISADCKGGSGRGEPVLSSHGSFLYVQANAVCHFGVRKECSSSFFTFLPGIEEWGGVSCEFPASYRKLD